MDYRALNSFKFSQTHKSLVTSLFTLQAKARLGGRTAELAVALQIQTMYRDFDHASVFVSVICWRLVCVESLGLGSILVLLLLKLLHVAHLA